MKWIPFIFLISYFFLGKAYSQSDTLLRVMDRLSFEDLVLEDSLSIRTQVSAASRRLQNISELPFTIYVIPRAEIIRNRYITLADALKSLPGIRVSQPGSALEGETFTMRGLLGNTYAKILINGSPIKPYVVSGMPLGAQLPIQQAQRIEVIYGPAAALYGTDASSGVINIVMIDSDRPVFTKASLHVGSENYKSLNLLFGGKIGRGENTLRFRLMGSNTRFDDRRIFYDQEELYNPSNYTGMLASINDVVNDLNYRGTPTKPAISNTPHESRSIGATLQYRFLSLSIMNMNRRDHSAIGYNPSAVSYANPLITTGEEITTVVAQMQFQVGKVGLQTKLELLSYEMDNRSTTIWIHPFLNNLLYNTVLDTAQNSIIRPQIENNFFSRLRYQGAQSDEFSLEQSINIPISNSGNLTLGTQYLIGTGNTFREFQPNPIDFNNDELSNLLPAFQNQDIEEYSLFILFFQSLGRRVNLLLSSQFLNRDNGDFAQRLRSFNPRMGLVYKFSDAVQLRSSYSTAIRAPSPYFTSSSYTFELGNYESLINGQSLLDSEKTQAYELGLRWELNQKMDLDLSASYTKTDGFINYNIAFNDLGPDRRLRGFTLGYFNDENSLAELWDFQAYLRFRNIVPSLRLSGSFGINFSEGREQLTTTNVTNFGNDVLELSGLRAHPTLLSRLSLRARVSDRVRLQLDQLIVARSLTRNSFRLNNRMNMPNPNAPSDYNDGYYTADLIGNYQINKNFLLYLKFLNVFNKKYAGIDASSSVDILRYNPQAQATLHLGLNYELN